MDYVEIVKETVKKTREQYAALVYDRNTLSEIDDLVIHFTINDQLFLETLLTEIRGKTISYALYLIQNNFLISFFFLFSDMMRMK